jgi:hypothetical protein
MKAWLSLTILWLLVLPAVARAGAQSAPPVGSWAQLPNTQIYPAIPSEAKPEGAPGGTPELWSPRGVFAFSGADVTQIDGVWGFLIWGGGHGDSPDNSLYWAPFDGSGAKRLMGPYLAPDKVYSYDAPLETYRSVSRNAPPTVTVAAAPKSRHTYSSLLRINLHGRPAVFCYGGSLYVGSGSGTAATRIFDLSQSYAQAMDRPDMGWALKAPAPSTAVSSSSGWDPVQKRVIMRSRGFIGAYYPDTDRWENWNIQNAPFGSDYQASVAMDVVGRKMYVLGDRLAEVIDLDTKAYTDLRGKPWVAAFPGVGGGTGYLAGPGVSWHARTKQIVAWVGGNNLLLINPATNTIKSVTMGGATVTAAPSAGTYGRFRVIPDTDQVVLVNGVTENVFIGIVPFGGTLAPTPAPPLTQTEIPTLSPALTPPPPSTATASSSTTPPATTTPAATTPSPTSSATPVTGQFLGVTGEDNVGQANQTTPNGTPDWHIRLQNVKRDPVAVQIDSIGNRAPNKRWVTPYNNMNWILAKQFAGGQLDLWFEPSPPPSTFSVQVSYADGTTDTISNIVMTVPVPVSTLAPVPPPTQTPPPTPTPTSGPSPGTVQVPPGQPLPFRQWVERPLPPVGQAYMAGNGGKHGRAFWHPTLGMVFAGGDWHTSQPQYEGGDGVGSEIWALKTLSNQWTLLRPFCVAGEAQPGGPDTVGWALDRKRNHGLMNPGFYFITQGAKDPCGSRYGWGGYVFDFNTRTFNGPDAIVGFPPPPGRWGGDGGASHSVGNPTLDEVVRIRNGPILERFNLAAQRWTTQRLSNGDPKWNPIPNRAQLVIDLRNQYIYWVDSQGRNVIKVNLKDASLTQIRLPSQYVAPPPDHEVYLAFDPVNRVLIIPNNVDMGQSTLNGLGVLHVDSAVWEWEAVPSAVMGSVWGFDEDAGALIGIGKRAQPSAYFLYKYK